MIAMTLGAIFLTTAVYRGSPYVFAKPICLYNHSNMWRSHHRVRSPLSMLSACAPVCAGEQMQLSRSSCRGRGRGGEDS